MTAGTRRRLTLALGAGGMLLYLAVGLVLPAASQTDAALPSVPIDHVVVIYLENRSFDSLYGLFPGADGLANAGGAAIQVDETGAPYDTLPPPLDSRTGVYLVDPRFPSLPNGPFDIGQFVPADQATGDLVHRFHPEQLQINGGAMNRFAGVSDAGGLTMGYYDGSTLPLWTYAQQYVLADRFFHAAFGGSMLNHFWLICACTPTYPDAPPDVRIQLAPDGSVVRDGSVTDDGYVVNNMQSVFQPHDPLIPQADLIPPQTAPHIGDRLDAKGLSWAWYSEGWADAIAGTARTSYSFVTEPFVYFADLADGTPAKDAHLKRETDFFAALQTGDFPNVAFVKPQGGDDEHPGESGVLEGDQYAAELIGAVMASPIWPRTAIIVTYDENGGIWDHVAPPVVDRWGPGTRVPALIISPWAKKGYVDHTTYDTTSILRFIEWRWGLDPLGDRDAAANDLEAAFDFTQTTATPVPPTATPRPLRPTPRPLPTAPRVQPRPPGFPAPFPVPPQPTIRRP